jgi:LDH2 family malate/lactate/ureidoglycolate dehydrogenase
MPPASGPDVLILHQALEETCTGILASLGLDPAPAGLVARTLVEADLRGVHSHGVLLMPAYARRLQAGGFNPRPRLRLIRESAATAVLDGDGGFGQVVAEAAMGIAIEKARASGSGVVGVVNSNHYAAGAHWAMMALPADCIGLALTSAGSAVAPWGGATPLLGTNPWTLAIPAGVELPVVLDMATSVVPAGRLLWAMQRSEEIPLGWAVDGDGRPTTDPREGLRGRLLSAGAYKGYGLAVIAELLTTALTDAGPGPDSLQSRADPNEPLQISHHFQAIDVAAFLPPDRFKARVDALVRRLKGSAREPGVAEILLPGEIEFRTERERRATGIPMPPALLADLAALARAQGLSAP